MVVEAALRALGARVAGKSLWGVYGVGYCPCLGVSRGT